MILAVEEMAEGYEMLTGDSPGELTFIHKVVDAGKKPCSSGFPFFAKH